MVEQIGSDDDLEDDAKESVQEYILEEIVRIILLEA
jgi:hypothetical protein